jgi:hypothetical protein
MKAGREAKQITSFAFSKSAATMAVMPQAAWTGDFMSGDTA